MSSTWSLSRPRQATSATSSKSSKYSKLSQSDEEIEDEDSDDAASHDTVEHSAPNSAPSSSASSGQLSSSKSSSKAKSSIIIHTQPIPDDDDDGPDNDHLAEPEEGTYSTLVLIENPDTKEDPNGIVKSTAEVATDPIPNINDPSKLTYFSDHERPTDYVLVYEVSKHDKASGIETDGQRRASFFQEMEMLGIEIEQSTATQRSGNITHFVKLHLPWDTIKDWAEKLHMRVPLQEAPGEITNWSQRVFDLLHLPSHNPFRQDLPAAPQHYYTAQFRADRLQFYVFNQDPERLFTRPQRSYVLHEMLQSVRYGDENRGEVGLNRLINEGIVRAAFPLHDGPLYEELPSRSSAKRESKNSPPHQRQILRTYWATFLKVVRYQPMDHIRGYYGEQVALYFSWLGLYNAWLVPLSVVGILAFLYGYLTISDDPVVEDICHHGHKFTMCPVCDHCPYWRLSQACSVKRLGYVFDNPGTCLSAFLLSLWAVLFVELWKRKNAELTHYFDCDEYHDEEEHPRAEFARNAPKMRRNVVTGQLEPYFPPAALLFRRVISWIASISFVLVIFLVTFGVILLRTSVAAELTRNHGMESPHRKLGNIVAATVTLVCVLVLNRFYVTIAQRLTAWEMHRTDRLHEDSLAWKAYWFQFVNSFTPVFYIAFIKGRFVGYPGHRTKVAGMILESCDIGGCFAELGFQLIVLMCGKQVFSNVLEFFLPIVVHAMRNRQHRLQSSTELNITFLNQQYKLTPFNGLTEEYMKMVIQFGFIILFGASFPLAPVFSLLNNILELRMDARKLVLQSRRPLARRAQSIGIWFLVLKWISMLSVWVNGFLIAYTSESLTQLLYAIQNDGSTVGYMNHSLAHAPIETTSHSCRYNDFRTVKGIRNKFYYELAVFRLAFVLLYVGVTYAISTLITSLIPDTPQHVTDAKKRRLFLANQALQSTPAAANAAYAKVRTSTQINPLARIKIRKALSRSRSRKRASLPVTTKELTDATPLLTVNELP